jgi:DNA-directed RNA polymerase specialized sigma24 family protein
MPLFVCVEKGGVAMSWLYERREWLDGLRPFVEIAHRLILPVPYPDRDDVEVEIILALKQVTDKQSEVGEAYLWGTARNVVRRYWRKKYRQAKMFRYLYEGNKGEMVADDWKFISHDGDSYARLDSLAILATLPQRLVEIGYKRLNGEELDTADEWYWMRHKVKLGCRKRGDQLSDWERRRVVQLRNQGLSVSKIAKTLVRSRKSIDLCLAKAGLREAPPYLTKK